VDTSVHRVFLPCVDVDFEEYLLEKARRASPQAKVSSMTHLLWSVQDVILRLVHFLHAKDAVHLLQVRLIRHRIVADSNHDCV
jgi:hypothetical protein